ncbi:hypothetical protein [Comamonas sp.]|uniref:hypothetical protein n=1 Tax=Comamonas sp. TaxID=34028 RepID=UPI003A905B0C
MQRAFIVELPIENMTNFYQGKLDFDGDVITVQRMAVTANTASLDCVLTWNGAPYSFQSTGELAAGTPNTFIFENYTFNISKGRPGIQHHSKSKLVLNLLADMNELDVTGTWHEEGESYEVTGLLENS